MYFDILGVACESLLELCLPSIISQMDGSELCRSCENADGCSSYLRPTNVGGGKPLTVISCRHFTCPLGIREARETVKDHLKHHLRMLHPVTFGTSHKPVGTRVVDTNGAILSEQDGAMYPTGQFISISLLSLISFD